MEPNFQNNNNTLNNIHNNKSIEDLIDFTLLTKFEFDIAVLFYKVCKNEYKTTSIQRNPQVVLLQLRSFVL